MKTFFKVYLSPLRLKIHYLIKKYIKQHFHNDFDSQVIEILFKTTKVSEAHKQILRLNESDVYPGFIHHMLESADISDSLVEHLLEQSLTNGWFR